jgi:hypothetical protein
MAEWLYVLSSAWLVALLAGLLVWRECSWNRQFLLVHTEYAAVMKDLLDRVMARDLPELVQAKTAPARPEEREPMGIEEFAERLIGS